MAGRPLLTLLLLLPGCLQAVDPWRPPGCDGLDEGPRNHDAPLAESMRGSRLELAQRIAAAVQDPLRSATPVRQEPGYTHWETGAGVVGVLDDRTPPVQRAFYRTPRLVATPTEAAGGEWANGSLERLGIHDAPGLVSTLQAWSGPEVSWFTSRASQHVAGLEVMDTGVEIRIRQNHGHPSQSESNLNLEPVYDTSGAQLAFPEHRARRVALEAIRCALEAEGDPRATDATVQATPESARLKVTGDTLAYFLGVSYGTVCHESQIRHPLVDARHGTLLSIEGPYAGCVE